MNVVLVIGSVMAISGSVNCLRHVLTEANMRLLKNGIEVFHDTSGRLPTEQEGLDVLVRKPGDWPDQVPWSALLEVDNVPFDGWGHGFIYVLRPDLPNGFGIYSCGCDGVTRSNGNDPDDINTWDGQRPWTRYYEGSILMGKIRSFASMLVFPGLLLAAIGGLVSAAARLARKPKDAKHL